MFRTIITKCFTWIMYAVIFASTSFGEKTSFDMMCRKQDVFYPFHLSTMQEFPGAPIQVIDMNHPSLADPFRFYNKYTAANKPVIIKHLADYILSKEGSDSQKFKYFGPDLFFRDAFMDGGYTEIQTEKYKIEDRHGPKEEMTFDQFINEIDDEKRSNELYGIVDLAEEENILEMLRVPWFISCLEHRHHSPILWYSSGGTSSGLHHDDSDNLLVVLAGTKRVILAHQEQWRKLYAQDGVPPGTSPIKQDRVDLNKYPQFGNLPLLKGRLEEGDGLFIPHSYWHQVVSDVASSGVTSRRNVAVNFWWNHTDDWKWWNPAEQDRFGHLELLKNYDAMRKTQTFKCTPRPVTTFHHIRTMKSLTEQESFKEYLFAKRLPLAKTRYRDDEDLYTIEI